MAFVLLKCLIIACVSMIITNITGSTTMIPNQYSKLQQIKQLLDNEQQSQEALSSILLIRRSLSLDTHLLKTPQLIQDYFYLFEQIMKDGNYSILTNNITYDQPQNFSQYFQKSSVVDKDDLLVNQEFDKYNPLNNSTDISITEFYIDEVSSTYRHKRFLQQWDPQSVISNGDISTNTSSKDTSIKDQISNYNNQYNYNYTNSTTPSNQTNSTNSTSNSTSNTTYSGNAEVSHLTLPEYAVILFGVFGSVIIIILILFIICLYIKIKKKKQAQKYAIQEQIVTPFPYNNDNNNSKLPMIKSNNLFPLVPLQTVSEDKQDTLTQNDSKEDIQIKLKDYSTTSLNSNFLSSQPSISTFQKKPINLEKLQQIERTSLQIQQIRPVGLNLILANIQSIAQSQPNPSGPINLPIARPLFHAPIIDSEPMEAERLQIEDFQGYDFSDDKSFYQNYSQEQSNYNNRLKNIHQSNNVQKNDEFSQIKRQISSDVHKLYRQQYYTNSQLQ